MEANYQRDRIRGHASLKPDHWSKLMSDAPKGGFNIGSVGGNVSVSAGGDVVAGDKVTTTTSTTTITNGFKQEQDKQQFVRNIEELRTALVELQSKIQEAAGVSQDDKDKIAAEVM